MMPLESWRGPPPHPAGFFMPRHWKAQAVHHTAMGNHEMLIGLALFVASELIGMSQLKENSVLQLLLHMAQELFPYQLKAKDKPSRSNRPPMFGKRKGRR